MQAPTREAGIPGEPADARAGGMRPRARHRRGLQRRRHARAARQDQPASRSSSAPWAHTRPHLTGLAATRCRARTHPGQTDGNARPGVHARTSASILAACRARRQTALFSATVPTADPLTRRPLSLRDPGDDHPGRGRTPTVAQVGQVFRSTGGDEVRAGLGECATPSSPPRRSCSCAHADQASARLFRPRCATSGLARGGALHGAYVSRHARGHDTRVQGREGADPGGHQRGGPRPGHPDGNARHRLRHAEDAETYVRRIGRTGRARRSGERSRSSSAKREMERSSATSGCRSPP